MNAQPPKPADADHSLFGPLPALSSRFPTKEGIVGTSMRIAADARQNSFEWPLKSFSQLVFILRGKISITLPDRGRQSARANEWFALSLGGWTSQCSIQGDASFIVIECDKSIWQAIATPLDALNHTKKACFGCAQRQEAVFFKNPLETRIATLSKEVATLPSDNEISRLLAGAKFLELLALVADHSSLGNAPQPEPCLRDADALSLAANYLETHLAEAHSLAKISRQVGLNEFKLKKGFRERFQNTVFGYLRQKRMEQARLLLAQPQASVLQTAHAVGYSNPSHFTRAFRESFGLNPREFIEQ